MSKPPNSTMRAPAATCRVVKRSSQGHGLASVVRSQTAPNDHCPHRRGGRRGRPLRRSAGRAPSHLRRVPAQGAGQARGHRPRRRGHGRPRSMGRAPRHRDVDGGRGLRDRCRPRPGPALADGGHPPGRHRSHQRADRHRRRQHRPLHPPGRAAPGRARRGASPRPRGAPDAQGVRGRRERASRTRDRRSRSSTASSA